MTNNNNIPQQLELIWDVLQMYNEQCLDPHHEEYDELWGDICTAMANVTEALGHDMSEEIA